MKNFVFRMVLLAMFVFQSSLFAQIQSTPGSQQVSLPSNGTQAPDFKFMVRKAASSLGMPMRNEHFLGKWLILDFWTRSCIVCIKNMPKLEMLQQRYSEKINFILVGKNDQRYGKGIENIYSGIARSEKLTLLAAFDTISSRRYGVIATPQIAIIDPSGKMYATTNADWLDVARLDSLVQGKRPFFPPPYQANLADQKVGIEQLHLGQERITSAYTSTLRPWKRSDGLRTTKLLDTSAIASSYQTPLTSIARLYMLSAFELPERWMGTAGYGEIWNQPILQFADTSLFISNATREQGLYQYSIALTKSKGKSALQGAIADDLYHRFGYLTKVDTLEMPVMELITLDRKRVESLASARPKKGRNDGTVYTLQGYTAADLLLCIGYYFEKTLLYDRSGISGKIDIELHGSMLSLENIRASLRNHGLDLRRVKKGLPVLIISTKN